MSQIINTNIELTTRTSCTSTLSHTHHYTLGHPYITTLHFAALHTTPHSHYTKHTTTRHTTLHRTPHMVLIPHHTTQNTTQLHCTMYHHNVWQTLLNGITQSHHIIPNHYVAQHQVQHIRLRYLVVELRQSPDATEP